MENMELLRLQLNNLISQVRQDIYMLSTINQSSITQQILQRIWDATATIHFISELLANEALNCYQPNVNQMKKVTINSQNPLITPQSNQSVPQINGQNFTIRELANFNGKNGRPAYVAVNGTVYDVTDSSAWAAASHFGLLAGKDLSQEFDSCHTGQQSILRTLPIVGRLIND